MYIYESAENIFRQKINIKNKEGITEERALGVPLLISCFRGFTINISLYRPTIIPNRKNLINEKALPEIAYWESLCSYPMSHTLPLRYLR